MKSLLPKHLRDLLFKKQENSGDEPRKFSTDLAFNITVQPIAEDSGTKLSQSQRHQLENERENLRHWKSLSKREQEVVALVCLGERNYEIAETLGIAHGTVKSHLENIFKKFGLRDRHAIKLALRDWDLHTWWEYRHLSPPPIPSPPTYE